MHPPCRRQGIGKALVMAMAFLFVFSASAARATEFVVNTTTSSNQNASSTAALNGGGFVVVWEDISQTAPDTSSQAIRAQRYDAAGVKQGAEFVVNTTTLFGQTDASVGALTDGGFVVAWTDASSTAPDTSDRSIRAQRYNADGTKNGVEFVANTIITNGQQRPSVAGLSNGGFVIAWDDNSNSVDDSSGFAVRAQVYDAAGAKQGVEFLVNTTTTNSQSDPQIAALSGGGFVIAWRDDSASVSIFSADVDIRAQLYDNLGARQGVEFLVNTNTVNNQTEPSVVALSGGGFVVAWADLSLIGGDTSAFGVKAQRYTAAGVKQGSEFLVNTTTANSQRRPRVAALSGGGFVITWDDGSLTGGDISDLAIRAQRYNADGTQNGVEFLANTTVNGQQKAPSIAGLTNGSFVVAWDDINTNVTFDIFADIFDVPAPAPEINVTGLSVSIIDGDTTPSVVDDTDFGNADITTGMVSHTFTIQNTGNAVLTLGANAASLSGTNAGDFSITTQPATTVAAAGSTTVVVQFDPSAVGARTATLSIANDDANEAPYDFALTGTGTAAPEIDVTGLSVSIVDGDTTPSVVDDTDFGNADISIGAISHTFTINNVGNATLNLGFNAASLSGANAGDFAITTQPANVLGAAGATTVVVQFNPSVAGLRTATLTIANDDANESPYNFSISGTGTAAPEMDVLGNGNSIADGDTTPVTNDDSDFGIVSLVSGASNANVFTIRNIGNATLSLTGTPRVVISGTNAADFVLTSDAGSASIAPAGSTTFTITFTPGAVGLRTASISIANDDSNENPYNFNIQGTGGTPEIKIDGKASMEVVDGDTTPSTADGTDFGSIALGSSSTRASFFISNTLGTDTLTLGSITFSGANAADFAIDLAPATSVAQGGAFTTLGIVFTPSANGLRTATLSIVNNDTNENPYNFSIQGTGTSPEIDVTGQAVSIVDGDTTPSVVDDTDFGNADITTGMVSHTFTIQNTGNAVLTLGANAASLSGTNAADFSITTQPGTSVSPANTTTVVVQFDPSVLGTRTATLSIANDDANEAPYDFALTGTGTGAPEIDVTGLSVSIVDGDTTPSVVDDTDFGILAVAGGSNANTFTITNSGNDVLNLTGSPRVVIGGAHAGDFTLTSDAGTSAAANGGTTTFTITFDPSASGGRNATVSIANDDANENPYTFTVTGTGTGAPEMDITGSLGISIVAGDMTPSAADNTDFGAVALSGGIGTNTYIIRNSGNVVLSLTGTPRVVVGGANGADFAVTADAATSAAAGGGTTFFTIEFDPSGGGTRTASVSIANDDADENPYVFSIAGTGANTPPTGAVIISGTLFEGQMLSADVSTLADADGLGTLSYQWRRQGADIGGATAQTYTLVQDDVGSTLDVVVSYTDNTGTGESIASASTTTVLGETTLFSSILPSARSGFFPGGPLITVFATVINAGSNDAQNCAPAVPGTAPVTLGYQQTDALNAPMGPADTPFDLSAGQMRSFILAFMPKRTSTGETVFPDFVCDNANVDVISGVNTVNLSVEAVMGPDILSILATPSGDGILTVPSGSVGAMAASALNIGEGDGPGSPETQVTVSVDTGSAALPLMLQLCEIDETATCISDLGEGPLSTMIGDDASFFAVFATDQSGGAGIALDPANARVFLRFTGADGSTRSVTSAAITVPASASADTPQKATALPEGRWAVMVRTTTGIRHTQQPGTLYVWPGGEAKLYSGGQLTPLNFKPANDNGAPGSFVGGTADGAITGQFIANHSLFMVNKRQNSRLDVWGVHDIRELKQ